MPSLKIITTPIEDYIYHTNKREEAKKKQKEPSTSFEEELKIATEKELRNDRQRVDGKG